MLTMLSMPMSAASGGAGPASAAPSPGPAAPSERNARSAAGSGLHASTPAQPAAPETATAGQASGGRAADSSGSKATSTQADARKPDASGDDSRAGRRATQAGSAAAGSSKPASRPATGTEGFSAALAQSLAATPADQAATARAVDGKASTEAGTTDPGTGPARRPAKDSGPSALSLLEQALAGGLVGAPQTAPTSTRSAAGTGDASQSGQATAIDKGVAAALTAQLTLGAFPDGKGGPSGSAPAAAAVAPAGAGTTGAATAALAAAQLAAASHLGGQAAKAEPASLAVSTPVGASGWADELGGKLTWMAHQGIESASLQLSPEHLGPVQVSISVHNGQASVWFGAAQSDTRAALQQSLPQLRQLFAGQGITLADSGVSRESPRGRERQSPGRPGGAVAAVTATARAAPAGQAALGVALGLVDTYV